MRVALQRGRGAKADLRVDIEWTWMLFEWRLVLLSDLVGFGVSLTEKMSGLNVD